jgi:hypothetical protein
MAGNEGSAEEPFRGDEPIESILVVSRLNSIVSWDCRSRIEVGLDRVQKQETSPATRVR